ncbi:hypothetical protein M3Y98_00454300 [Aphelenchoides besseyi]|nr:hypothetical protein M3Y98_00454300 [Aphelenchoides besseyi]KAI6207424.1 hypothetical protein M3Y96_00007600 [Aphelenchoides besseyi]
MKRALFCETTIIGHFDLLAVSGANGRFRFFSYNGISSYTHWIIDTFHSRMKYDVTVQRIGFACAEEWLPNSRTFKMKSATMRLPKFGRLQSRYRYSFILNARSVGLFAYGHRAPNCYTTINLNGNFKLENEVAVEPNLTADFESLVSVSLPNGSVTTQSVNMPEGFHGSSIWWLTTASGRRAQLEPEFYEQMIQKLPTNCHLRWPWTDDQ